MLDLIASFLVRGLNMFFHIMPIRFNLWVGRRLGELFYFLSGKRKRITYSNLKAAFYGEKSPRELRRIAKNVYINTAQTFVEILSMTKVDKKYVSKYVDVDVRRIERAAKNPKGMILISAHFGNWELSTVTSVMKGFPLYMLARDQKMERLNELLNLLRELKGNIVIRKGMDIKNIFKMLHEGKSLGMLADQNAGAGGELIDFFGRPASTVTGPYRFAQKSGAWVLPAFIHRKKGPYHELIIEEPMVIRGDDDVLRFAKKYNRLLEKHIRDYPDQWLWMHKKWKMTPVKRIMVLDDGKRGHLKQSLAVVKQIRRYREDKGYAPGDTKVEIIPVQFRNRMTRAAFSLLSLFFASYLQGRPELLRWAFKKESYEKAVNSYADVIVSCASGLFAVNKMLKIENWARNVTVLDPGRINRKWFDLVVIPAHDVTGGVPPVMFSEKTRGGNLAKKENIVITELAPNLIQRDELDELKSTVKETRAVEYRICLGLLLGGDNPYFTFSDNIARSVAKAVRKAAELSEGCLYITTSRRTPERVEEILEDSLKGDPRCVRFVSGKNDPDERTVEKVLASSDIVIVSGESISMVSEAVSSGKPVLVFMPEKKKRTLTKYEKFLRRLAEKDYIKLLDPEDIPEEVNRIVREKTSRSLPDDDKRIYEKLYKLF